MITEGQRVFVRVDSGYTDGFVEEIIKEGNKKYYGISGFATWKSNKEVFETEAKAKKICGEE